MDTFLNILNQMQAENLDLFLAIGQNLLRGLATIMIVWFGVSTALESSSYGGGFKFDRFVKLIFLISFCYFMVNKYSEFSNLITGMGDYLTLKINSHIDSSLEQGLTLYYTMPDFSWADLPKVGQILVLILAWFLSVVFRAISFVIIAFGYLVRAVLVLVGPVFIPFYLIPQLRWLFTGWLKALIQYSFYPVIANLVVYVLQLFFVSANIYEQQTVSDLIKSFPFIATVLVAGIYSLTKIPKIVNHLFSGMSGL